MIGVAAAVPSCGIEMLIGMEDRTTDSMNAWCISRRGFYGGPLRNITWHLLDRGKGRSRWKRMNWCLLRLR